MKTLQNPADKRAFMARLNALTPQAQASWGKMSVDQMLRHLSDLVETATGTRTQPGSWLTSLLTVVLGRFLKSRLVSSDRPLPRNLGSAPLPASEGFAAEKARLLALLDRFEGRNLSTQPLPIFGRMSATDWDKFLVKQLEHHLLQFGA